MRSSQPDLREQGREKARAYLRGLATDPPKDISMAEELIGAEWLHSGGDDAFISGFLEVIGEARQLQETLEAPAKRREALQSKVTTAWVSALLCLVLYLFYLSWLPVDEQRPFPLPQLDLFGAAHSACTHFVSGTLDAPATADFAGRFSRGTRTSRPRQRLSGWHYTVTSHVDAENRLGAKVRTRFRCGVTWAGERWTLDDLQTAPWSAALQ